MNKGRYFTLSLVLLSSVAFASSQENLKIVAVHPYIGDTLDASERETYDLLPGVEGYGWSVFFQRPDGMLDVKVSHIENGVRVDTILNRGFSRTDLWNHVQRIEGSLESEGTGEGKDVIIYRKSGGETRGSLLAVHDKKVIVARSKGRSHLSANDLVAIDRDDVTTVVVEGGSNVLHGMGIGGLIGGGAGMVAGFASGDDPPNQLLAFSAGEKAMMGFVGGGVVGVVVGGIAGAVTSSSDQTYDVHSSADYASLKSQACYKDREPYVVRRMK